MSVILLTTGVPGCGKTYVRCARFLVDDFLVNATGVHISNFPLNVEAIAEAVSANSKPGLLAFLGRKSRALTPDDIKKRLHVIPDEVLLSWSRQESGPWDYFQGWDLKYAHIAIDEIHNFVSASKSPAYIQKWDEFLGEIRHRGCTFEGLTQDIDQVDKVFTGRASLRLELIPAEDLRDPFFKIRMGDWYELKAAFMGSYHKTVFEFEKRKQGKSWRSNHTRRFLITPDYFKYYHSFNASLAEKATAPAPAPAPVPDLYGLGNTGVGDSEVPPQDSAETSNVSEIQREIQYEYQRRTRLSLLWWFVSRNFFTLSWRLVVAVFVFWLCFCGGLTYFITGFLALSQEMAASNSKPVSVQKSFSAVPSPVSTGETFHPVEGSLSEVPTSTVPVTGVPIGQGVPLKEYTDELKKQQLIFDGYKPAMFFDGSCWLRNGIKITEEYRFNDGPYKDFSVSEISQVDRYYRLDDGRFVHMY